MVRAIQGIFSQGYMGFSSHNCQLHPGWRHFWDDVWSSRPISVAECGDVSLCVFRCRQFSAIAMFADHASMWAIVLTTCMLNTRHLLMGLSISPYYQRFSSAQVNGLAYFLTDEQYAISLNRFRQHPSEASYIVAVGGSFLASWILGTWLGTVAGQWIPDPASLGLDFSFTAMFVALAFYQLTSFTRTLTFLLCGGLAVIFALLLPNGLHLLVAGLVAFMIGYVWPTKGTEKKENPNSEQKVETA